MGETEWFGAAAVEGGEAGVNTKRKEEVENHLVPSFLNDSYVSSSQNILMRVFMQTGWRKYFREKKKSGILISDIPYSGNHGLK